MQLIQAKDIDFYYVTTAAGVEQVVQIMDEHKLYAIDTETYPLFDQYGDHASWRDPHTSRIRLIQVNVPNNNVPWVIDVLAVGREGLSPLIAQLQQEDRRKIIHNATYDLKQFKGTFDVWLPNTWCTKVLMQRLGVCTGFKSSQARGHSLKSLSRDFFDIHLSKMEQTSDWSAPELRPEQLEYAALDVGAPKSSGIKSILLEGYDLILNTLIADPPEGFGVGLSLNLDQEANQVLARIEYTGMPINEAILAALMTTAKAELEDCRLKLCRDLDLPVEQKLTFEGGAPKLAIVVPDKVSKLLNNPKAMTERINEKLKTTLDLQLTDVQSSTLETILKKLQSDSSEDEGSEDEDLEESFFMEECRANIDLIDTLLTYKEKLKLTGTNYQALINPVTGCLHSAFNVIGASTGRMSSGGGKYTFNAQQLSKVSVKIDHLENPFESKSIIL